MVTNSGMQLPQSFPVFNQNARIFNNRQPRRSRALHRGLILYTKLHPHGFRAHANCTLHHCRYFLRPPENIHDLNFLRHVLQPRVTLLSQHLRLIRIHGNNPVTRRLHVFRHAVARPRRIRRQSNYRDALVFFQDFKNWIGAAHRAIRQQDSHRAASSLVPARLASTCAKAPRHFSFSSVTPTEVRIASGNPIHPSGRTITPRCSSSSLTSFATGPTGTNTKFASLTTGRKPSFVKPSVKRFRSAAFAAMHRSTCSLSSKAASAAACATPEVLNGVLSLFIAVSSSAVPIAYPIRSPASPYTFENVRRISKFFRFRYASTEFRSPTLTA